MPRKPNLINIGAIDCACGCRAAVRQDVHGRSYVFCPRCKTLHHSSSGGQTYLQKHAVIWGSTGAAPDREPSWIRENRIPPHVGDIDDELAPELAAHGRPPATPVDQVVASAAAEPELEPTPAAEPITASARPNSAGADPEQLPRRKSPFLV